MYNRGSSVYQVAGLVSVPEPSFNIYILGATVAMILGLGYPKKLGKANYLKSH